MKPHLVLCAPILLLTTGAPAAEMIDLNPTDQSTFVERYDTQATLYPIPDYDGDLLDRSTVVGGWAGYRTALAKNAGIQVVADVTQFYQGVVSGGIAEEGSYNGTADYHIRFDSGQAGLWPGGFIDVHAETYWGRGVNTVTGALLPVNIDPALAAPAGEGTYLSHVIFTQFLSEKFALTFGKLDTTIGDDNAFAHGVGDRRFQNLAFSFNPVTVLLAPYSTLGIGGIYLLGGESMINAMIFDGDGQIDRAGFDTVFEGNTTITANIKLGSNFFDSPGHHWLGFLYGNGTYNAQNQNPRIFFPGNDAMPTTEGNSWAIFYNFDQYLVSDPDNPEVGWGLFGRFGIADQETNIIHTFYSLGVGGQGIIPGRDRDRFGIGWYYMNLSDERLALFTEDKETGLEIFYNASLTPWLELSADYQFIDGALRFGDNAHVLGLRGRIIF
ncbi:MAG: carbohydrate porin [Verrucomicrobiota bacterium]